MGGYQGPERRAEVEDLKALVAKLFEFRDDQIERNTACDLQLGQHEKDLSTLTTTCRDCIGSTLPKIRGGVMKLSGTLVFVGVMVGVLLLFVNGVSSNADHARADSEKAVQTVEVLKNDMTHIKADLNDLKQTQKEMRAEAKEQNLMLQEILRRVK